MAIGTSSGRGSERCGALDKRRSLVDGLSGDVGNALVDLISRTFVRRGERGWER